MILVPVGCWQEVGPIFASMELGIFAVQGTGHGDTRCGGGDRLVYSCCVMLYPLLS